MSSQAAESSASPDMASTEAAKPCGWVRRNTLHVVLFAFAAAAIILAILFSLDACSTETTTYNTTTTVVTKTTVETTAVTQLAMVTLIDGSGSMKCCPGAEFGNTCMNACQPTNSSSSDYTYWAGSQRAIPVLHNALNSAMNAPVSKTSTTVNKTTTNRTSAETKAADSTVVVGKPVVTTTSVSFTDRFKVGIVQWSDISVTTSQSLGRGLTVGAPLAAGVTAANNYISSATLQTGGTYWGNPLCKCYSMLKADEEAWASASKMCVLMTDGKNTNEISLDFDYAASTSSSESCSTGSLKADWVADGKPKANGAASDDTLKYDDVAHFVRSKNITIFGINTDNAAQEGLYKISSCDQSKSYTDACDYYLYLNDFKQLEDSATAIGSLLRKAALSTGSASSSSAASSASLDDESIGICSLAFLYALLAFIPLLLYLIYRCIMIKATAKTLRKSLYDKIRTGEIKRVDKCGFATVATDMLLPDQKVGDIDHGISFIMFFCCPCLLPISEHEARKQIDTIDTLNL